MRKLIWSQTVEEEPQTTIHSVFWQCVYVCRECTSICACVLCVCVCVFEPMDTDSKVVNYVMVG